MKPAFALAAVLLLSLPAEAGLGSLLSKLGRGGRVASAGAKTARAARFTKTAVAGLTAAVVAERAAASMARIGVEGAHAGFLARGAAGELLFATKATHGAPTVIDDVGKAVTTLGEGAKPTVFIDPSVAASTKELAKLPPDTVIVLVRRGEQLPVRRVETNGVVEFVVDHGGDVVDLADFGVEMVDAGSSSDSDDDSETPVFLLTLGIVGVVILVWKLKG